MANKPDPKWLQHAGEHMRESGTEGALHRKLGIPEDQTIPMSRINEALRKRGLSVKTRKQLQFAKTAKEISGKHHAEAAMHPGVLRSGISKVTLDFMEKLRKLRLDPDLVERQEDGKMVYHGDVHWVGLGLTRFPELFVRIAGNVDIRDNKLQDLRGLPRIDGDLLCSGNPLPADTAKPAAVHGKFTCKLAREEYRGQHATRTPAPKPRTPAKPWDPDQLYGRSQASAGARSLEVWAQERGITLAGHRVIAPEINSRLLLQFADLSWEFKQEKKTGFEPVEINRRSWTADVRNQDKVVAVAVLTARDGELQLYVNSTLGRRLVGPVKHDGDTQRDLQQLVSGVSVEVARKLHLGTGK